MKSKYQKSPWASRTTTASLTRSRLIVSTDFSWTPKSQSSKHKRNPTWCDQTSKDGMIDITTRTPTKISNISENFIEHYKSTFPKTKGNTWLFMPGKKGNRVNKVMQQHLNASAVASHNWLRHTSRLKNQCLSTESPEIKPFPLSPKAPRPNHRIDYLAYSTISPELKRRIKERKKHLDYELPTTDEGLAVLLKRIKETERTIRQEPNFIDRLRTLKPKIALEETKKLKVKQ